MAWQHLQLIQKQIQPKLRLYMDYGLHFYALSIMATNTPQKSINYNYL